MTNSVLGKEDLDQNVTKINYFLPKMEICYYQKLFLFSLSSRM